MFCPQCKAEYRQGFTRCADCDVELVENYVEQFGIRLAKKVVAPEKYGTRLWAGNDLIFIWCYCGASGIRKSPVTGA